MNSTNRQAELQRGLLAARDTKPVMSYHNGTLFQNGQPANATQNDAYERTNPYLPENWLATPQDRAGRTPGALPDVPSLSTPRGPAPQLDAALADQLVALSMQRNIPVPELLQQLLSRSSTPSTPSLPVSTTTAPLSAPVTRTSTTPLTTPLPGLTTRSGRARQPIWKSSSLS